MAAALRARPARPEELEAAVRLVLTPSGGQAGGAAGAAEDVRAAAAEFIAMGRERGITFDGIHVAEHQGRLVSAVLPVISPGRTMLILSPPGGLAKGMDAGTRRLIEPVCRYCAQWGVHLAQALVDPQDAALERVFADEAFARMAELYYLQVQAAADAPYPSLPPGVSWVTYSDRTHGLFGRAVLASYQDSLDCPALNGRRNVEDILAGHKATGMFDPTTWLVLREGESPLGVLLLSESLRGDAVELVYLGLAAAARGRGLGEVLMRQALAITGRSRQPRLCLAVDSRNAPALKLYYRHGMQRIGSKVAMLRDLRVGRSVP
ncbi:MAG TPA: GNAT family N-acetyltransferase [Tepidisphaeraceae bacterium]|jgi:ribosomal protein S18 acetylase RimI-like enzyme